MTSLLSADSRIQKWLRTKNIFQLFPTRCYRRPSHYQILQLNENCTSKDIRNAFIKLSKENHPDGDVTDNSRHSRFVLINEAYAVLIKKETRATYDDFLRMRRSGMFNEINRRGYPDISPTPKWTTMDDVYMYYQNQAQNKKYSSRPYYGIPGVKRVANKYIAYGCVIAFLLSSITFIFATKNLAERRRIAIDEMNTKNYEYYNSVKRRASENGIEEQINRFKQKLDESDGRGPVFIRKLE